MNKKKFFQARLNALQQFMNWLPNEREIYGNPVDYMKSERSYSWDEERFANDLDYVQQCTEDCEQFNEEAAAFNEILAQVIKTLKSSL